MISASLGFPILPAFSICPSIVVFIDILILHCSQFSTFSLCRCSTLLHGTTRTLHSLYCILGFIPSVVFIASRHFVRLCPSYLSTTFHSPLPLSRIIFVLALYSGTAYPIRHPIQAKFNLEKLSSMLSRPVAWRVLIDHPWTLFRRGTQGKYGLEYNRI
jgi:hypothetical protein